MLEFILGNLGGATFARTVRDDDIVDQLHHHVMTTSLLVLGMTVAGQQFMGNPINCWIPAQYDVDDSDYQDYVDSYCWISHMYNVPFTEELPLHIEDRLSEDKDVNFYRWVVVMMFFQALLFWLPRLIWKTCCSFCGLNIEKIIKMALEAQLLSDETRQEKMSNISAAVDRWLGTFRKAETKPLLKVLQTLKELVVFDKRSGNYLTRQNLFTKLLYLVNVVCQFELLSSFLGTNYWRYGTDVLAMLATESSWTDESNFPRVGMCDFEIRQLQNTQRHTVQCALPINLFLEKIYALLWFVMAGLSILTAVSLVSTTVFTCRREHVMNQYAVLLDKTLKDKEDRGNYKTFVETYLRDDGAFVVRTVGNNTSDILAFDLLTQLWSKFKDTYPEIEECPTTSEGNL
ncbi:innexin unc-9-like [Haliotis rubra]|uniref:innexin unc-9-like n=1 Tax=Haliotis rubra TaxID=36100 RepID=UPI001EE5B93F|nr:innexin unc-9-like [Haliotis rubra]XP_046585499.1 innexin unc-9-like [Haliotis rubra]